MREVGEKTQLCIDHHVSNTEYAERLLLAPEYAAAAELMFELLSSMKEVRITSSIADSLYTCLLYTSQRGSALSRLRLRPR